jgi:hypothetical protein
MNRAELFEKAKKLAGERITETMGQDEKMETLEIAMMELLDLQIMQPAIGRIGSPADDAGKADLDGFLPPALHAGQARLDPSDAKRQIG